MTTHVYKHIDLTGSSTTSSDDAVRTAIAKAAKTIRGMSWFEFWRPGATSRTALSRTGR